LAFNEINQGTVGINGLTSPIIDPLQYQFKLVNISDNGHRADGLQAVYDLAINENVAALIGSDWSSLTIPQAMLAGIFKVPMVSGSSTSNDLQDRGMHTLYIYIYIYTSYIHIYIIYIYIYMLVCCMNICEYIYIYWHSLEHIVYTYMCVYQHAVRDECKCLSLPFLA
jgi:hypothetical protein